LIFCFGKADFRANFVQTFVKKRPLLLDYSTKTKATRSGGFCTNLMPFEFLTYVFEPLHILE